MHAPLLERTRASGTWAQLPDSRFRTLITRAMFSYKFGVIAGGSPALQVTLEVSKARPKWPPDLQQAHVPEHISL
eukprot:128500-Amphidinium_carterae.1